MFIVGMILVASITLFGFVPIIRNGMTCEDCYCIEGVLTGYSSRSPFHYNVDEYTHYCSEGFPDDFENYFGKNVRICGMSGCGRASIDSVELIN